MLFVTPLAGVWIEISCDSVSVRITNVTPLAGVWIEIVSEFHVGEVMTLRHSPCGSVD